jgi:hypothetical protein
MVFRSQLTLNHFALNDETSRDLIRYAKQTPEIVIRAKKQILTYYQGVTKEGIIKFMTPSGTTPGLYWLQEVELSDLRWLIKKYEGKKKPLEIVRIALQGSIKTTCNDPDGNSEPSWLFFGHKYKATVSGYNLGTPENRFPKVRNPTLAGGGCKHVRAVMEALPFHAGIITKDLIKNGMLSK